MVSLETDQIPEFKKALGADWDKLRPIAKHHYDIPGRFTKLHVTGVMDEVKVAWVLKPIMPMLQFLGALVAESGKNIATDLINEVQPNDNQMYWKRTLHFPKRDRTFFTTMVYYSDHTVIEYVRFGLGIKLALTVEDGCLLYNQTSYVLKLGKWNLGFPNWLGLGRGWIEECPISDTEFKVNFGIDHPLFGRVFGYNGKFRISESS